MKFSSFTSCHYKNVFACSIFGACECTTVGGSLFFLARVRNKGTKICVCELYKTEVDFETDKFVRIQ